MCFHRGFLPISLCTYSNALSAAKAMALLIVIASYTGFFICGIAFQRRFTRIMTEVSQLPGGPKLPEIGLSTPMQVIDAFQRHREHYPRSPTRAQFWIWSVLTIVLMFAVIATLQLMLNRPKLG
jgi:hypothetical protein